MPSSLGATATEPPATLSDDEQQLRSQLLVFDLAETLPAGGSICGALGIDVYQRIVRRLTPF